MEEFEWRPLREEEIKWVGIDFDDTLCHNSGYPDYVPTIPLAGAVEAMNKLHGAGYKIVIFTARHWIDYHNIEGWCTKYNIPIRRIICGKPVLKWMIDDKNIEFRGDWGCVDKVIGN